MVFGWKMKIKIGLTFNCDCTRKNKKNTQRGFLNIIEVGFDEVER